MSEPQHNAYTPAHKNTFRMGFALKFAAAGLVLVLLVGAVIWGMGDDDTSYTTFAARRGPLDIKVLEGGNIESLDSQEIKSEVKGWQGVKILYIVEEGYYVTAEDVKNKKKLVELDTSELVDKLTTAEIQFKGTQASLSEAEQGYEIQLNQSESDIYSAQVETNLARYEMEKFLGKEVTADVLKQLAEYEAKVAREREAQQAQEEAAALKEDLRISMETAATGGESEDDVVVIEGGTEPDAEMALTTLKRSHPEVNFSAYATEAQLGDGEANQKVRELEDKLLLARKDYGLAQTALEGKKRLFEKQFLTQQELDNAILDVEKKEIEVEAAETAKTVFLIYEFPKQSEKLMSDFILAKRKLERAEKSAISELAKARSKLLSAEATYTIEMSRIKEYKDQIAVSSMYAERPGLVVYGGSGRDYWNEEPIKEGATVRERQAIITIPDTTKMAVLVNIHESDIKQVKVGQQAKVTVEAFANQKLTGEVTKVSVLPDSENRWRNPDIKVYETTVKIHGAHEWLKPGMSAETEILIDRLKDALYIPIQSVVPDGRDKVCFVLENGQPVKRVVETGPMTVEFIVITEGLQEGEEVLIRPPAGSRNDAQEDESAEGEPIEAGAEDSGGTAPEATPEPIGASTTDPATTENTAAASDAAAAADAA